MKRHCPSCKKKCINPLEFKRDQTYRCPCCGVGVEINAFCSVALSFLLAFFIGIAMDNGYTQLGKVILIVLIIRVVFLDKNDAMLLPLIPNYDK